MDKFNNPRSSSSSDNCHKGIRMHSSSYESKSENSSRANNESNENMMRNFTQKETHLNNRYGPLSDLPMVRSQTDAIIAQVQETKFLVNTEGLSHLNHDSEMVDNIGDENTTKIARCRDETRVVRSDANNDTNSKCKSTYNMSAQRIGKSTRSRNVMNPIKASLNSIDSKTSLNKIQRFDGNSTKEQTFDQTAMKSKTKKKKLNEQRTIADQNTMDELSDFETFRKINKDSISVLKSKANFSSKRINKESFDNFGIGSESNHKEIVDSSFGVSIINVSETKNLKYKAPKIMGFFENEAIESKRHSRNINLSNTKALSCLYNTNQTKVVPISLDESERQISLSPRFNHDGISNTLDYSKPGESSRVNEIKLTDRHTEKYSNTVDGAEGKYGKNKRCTGKIIKKIKLQENYMKSSKKGDESSSDTNDVYGSSFQLDESDFQIENKKTNKEEKDESNISDVAKTFRNLRNQLMNQNRSRAKLDINKIQSQKNASDQNNMSFNSMSRNTGEIKMNSLSPKVVERDIPIFDRYSSRDVFQSPSQGGISRINSATTLYIETVSNKNNEEKNNDTSGNTLEEEKFESTPFEGRARELLQSIGGALKSKVANQSLNLEEKSESPYKKLQNEFNLPKLNTKFKAAPSKRGKYVRKLRKEKKQKIADKPHPDFIFCDNDDVLEKEENAIIFEESEPNKALPQYQKPLFFNKKHNLSKVEEEDFDDTFYV